MSTPPRETPEQLQGELETLRTVLKDTINARVDYKSYFQTHLPHIEQEQREAKKKEYHRRIEEFASKLEEIEKEIKEKENKLKEYED